MALGEVDERLRTDAHCPQFFLFTVSGGVVEVVQTFEALLNPGNKIQHPGVIDLIIQHGVTGRALLHELCEEASLIGSNPFVRHLGEEPVAHAPSAPERDDRLLIDPSHLFADREGYLRACIEDGEVFQAVAAQLRIGRSGLGGGAFFADNQLALADIDSLVFHQVPEGKRPLNRRGYRLAELRVEFGQQDSPLGGNARMGIQAFPPQVGDTVARRHSDWPPIVTCSSRSRRIVSTAVSLLLAGGDVSGSS